MNPFRNVQSRVFWTASWPPENAARPGAAGGLAFGGAGQGRGLLRGERQGHAFGAFGWALHQEAAARLPLAGTWAGLSQTRGFKEWFLVLAGAGFLATRVLVATTCASSADHGRIMGISVGFR